MNSTELELAQLAKAAGRTLTKSPHTFNQQPVWKLSGERGLWTAHELRDRLAN